MSRKEDRELFSAMVYAGNTPKQIAIDLGISRQAVSHRALAMGLRDRLRENKPVPKRTPHPMPESNVAPIDARLKGARRAFNAQRRGAARRGIGWELSFDQWWSIWEPHYDRRGARKGCLVMCRTGDVGPYAVGNVRIATPKENLQEAALERLTRRGRKGASRSRGVLVAETIFDRNGVFREYTEQESN